VHLIFVERRGLPLNTYEPFMDLRTRAGDPRTRFTIVTIVSLIPEHVSYRPVSNDFYVLAYILSVERRGLPLNTYEPLMDYPRVAAEILVA
jgi:hypothetical protein